jgi:hypothetical protein
MNKFNDLSILHNSLKGGLSMLPLSTYLFSHGSTIPLKIRPLVVLKLLDELLLTEGAYLFDPAAQKNPGVP